MDYHKREKALFEKGYYVDRMGNLYNPNGKRIVGSINSQGRRTTGVRDSRKCVTTISFHRMVAYAKYGDRLYDDNMLVRHLDGNPLNNSWDNIAIGTQHDNMMDMDISARIKRSSMTTKKYTDEIAREIRECHRNGMSYQEIMKRYNISSKGTLSFIVNKRLL